MHANMLQTRMKAWTPAVPLKAPDNIVSSDYTTAKPFIPSYEKEPACIGRLLMNDYQRIWWKEKQIWDRVLATKIATKKILPRMLVKRKVPSCVTVKYLTKAERLKEKMERKKKLSEKQNCNKSTKKEEENKTEPKEIEPEIKKVEKPKEIPKEKPKESEEIKLMKKEEQTIEVKSPKIEVKIVKEEIEPQEISYLKDKISIQQKMESEKHEETQLNRDEELISKDREEMKTYKESKSENGNK